MTLLCVLRTADRVDGGMVEHAAEKHTGGLRTQIRIRCRSTVRATSSGVKRSAVGDQRFEFSRFILDLLLIARDLGVAF
ncbi:hypothetical protein ZHAS_00014116 [Anopheles sinensis]|uniref:Uncharacterized protein n=1 Tax=Anopheles sinensis TaxID=74873 RepID=A0A084W7N5_ANOSI|nr:hypothetical protein ZHAS_00014116 [Anopheles sinensis]